MATLPRKSFAWDHSVNPDRSVGSGNAELGCKLEACIPGDNETRNTLAPSSSDPWVLALAHGSVGIVEIKGSRKERRDFEVRWLWTSV